MSEEKVVSDHPSPKVVSDDIEIPEISDGSPATRLSFNRENKPKETVGEVSEKESEETGETVHPMAQWTSHRYNITDEIRQAIIDVHDTINSQTYKTYQAKDFWKLKYTGGLEITKDDIEKTLDTSLHSGKYKGISVRSVLVHDLQYMRWLCERQLFKSPESRMWRIVDLVLPEEWRCRFFNQEILRQLREHKKELKRKFESNYQGKFKKFKKY